MSQFETSIPAGYFDAIYADDPDPWRFAGSSYERDKYAATLAALPQAGYASALEIGCSIGVLTRQLASRCAALLALDVAEAALHQARRRCADRPNVQFERAQVPGEWPDGRFDLIVLSEVVYFLDRVDVVQLANQVSRTASPEADIVLVHWLGPTSYPLSGDEAAEKFMAASAGFAEPRHCSRTAEYRLDVLRVRSDRTGAALRPGRTPT